MAKGTHVRGPDPRRHSLAVPILKLTLQVGLGRRPQPGVRIVLVVRGEAMVIRHLIRQALKVLNFLIY